jgi:dolichol-phosphate mannosyltransferase
MDADFSHAPSSLAEMMRTIQSSEHCDCGLVIGSRYVRGGKIVGWPLFRHLSSRAVNLAARLLLRLPTRDNSGAFRVYRNSTLEAVGIEQVQSDGYAYLEELVWRIHRANISIVEVPITFTDREKGASKTSFLIGVSVFWHLGKILMGRVK